MSFGFSVSDFLAVGKLAWDLYHECFLIARGAPQEFKLLVEELKTLHAMMQMFDKEFQGPQSILLRAGGDGRKKMISQKMESIRQTLNGLNEAFQKHRNLESTIRSTMKRGWDKFKWSLDSRDIDGLRSKLTYHNGIMQLLLTCVGNSSLQRLETVAGSIEVGVNELKGFVQKARRGTLCETNGGQVDGAGVSPGLSANSNTSPLQGDVRRIFIEKYMKAAEVSQRWTAIGITEWLKAGRWWLFKASISLRLVISADDTVSEETYINLLKAFWILTDMISIHPQLSHIELPERMDIMRLIDARANPPIARGCFID